MATSLYDNARQLFLTAGLNWSSDTIKVVLVDTGTYTVNLATHANLSDIIVGARIATSAALTSKTVVAGVADAADVTFTAISGVSIESIVIYKDTGVAGTSSLIAYIDNSTGLPIIPNGGDIIITWANTTNKIFRL